jgi:hypothetical protein
MRIVAAVVIGTVAGVIIGLPVGGLALADLGLAQEHSGWDGMGFGLLMLLPILVTPSFAALGAAICRVLTATSIGFLAGTFFVVLDLAAQNAITSRLSLVTDDRSILLPPTLFVGTPTNECV